MRYTHVSNRTLATIKSPFDALNLTLKNNHYINNANTQKNSINKYEKYDKTFAYLGVTCHFKKNTRQNECKKYSSRTT